MHRVRLNLSAWLISYDTLFFSYNKSASNGLSAIVLHITVSFPMLDWGKLLVLTLQNNGLPMLSTAVLCFHTKRKVCQCLLIVV